MAEAPATDWLRVAQELAQNPLKMSAGARQAMDAELGVEKARKQRIDAAQRFADMPVRITTQG